MATARIQAILAREAVTTGIPVTSGDLVVEVVSATDWLCRGYK